MLIRFISLLCSLGYCTPLFSQTSDVTGRIVDAVTQETLPFASVFLNSSTIATSTDENGVFKLINVSPGIRELVVFSGGYETIQAYISVNEDLVDLGVIEMIKPEPLLIPNSRSQDAGREKSLKQFKKTFLGEGKLSVQCDILNPYAIDFSKGPGGILLASSNEPIEVSNMALGYKLSYHLTYFEAGKDNNIVSGQVRFTEIATKGGATALQWMENRKELYLGSRQHLLKSILDNQIKENGFYLYSDNTDTRGNTRTGNFSTMLGNKVVLYDTVNIVFKGRIPNTYKILLKGKIEVHCRGKVAKTKTYNDVPYSVGWMEVEGDTIFVNRDGSILNPQEVTTLGAMKLDNLSELLPADYTLEKIVRIRKASREIEASRIEENVYLHLDKPYYYPGEMMWFKAYLNYRYPELRDSMSRTLNVELINPQRKIVKSQLVRIDNGVAFGNWVVTDTLSAGNYHLRAYTSLNQNFDASELFVKTIPILGKTEKVDDGELYSEKKDEFQISFQPHRSDYETRDSIGLKLTVRDKNGRLVKSNLSVSITDAKQVLPVRDPMTILSEFPFDHDHGNAIIKEIQYPVEYGISYTGQYLNKKQKPEKVTLSILQGNFDYLSVVETDFEGKFYENSLLFYDSAEFRFQVRGDKNRNDGSVRILEKPIPSLEFKFPTYNLKTINTGKNQRLISEYEVPRGARLLSEVLIKGSKLEENVVRPYGKPDYVISAKELDISTNNLLIILQGKVPGLSIRTVSDETGSHTEVRVIRATGLTLQLSTEPLIMIDNVPLTGSAGSILQSINAYTIESIEVVTRVSPAYGSAGVNGVISIYTKKGLGVTNAPVEKGLQIIKLRGYAHGDSFRFPSYGTSASGNGQIDYRSILYWNPLLTTNDDGVATVSFFAADMETRYRIVAEGVTEGNEPVRGVYYLNIGANKQ